MSKILLLLLLLQVFGVFAHSWIKRAIPDTRQNDVSRPLKQGHRNVVRKRDWMKNAEDILLMILSNWEAKRWGNLTLIGWQTVLKDDGTVNEVRTVELGFRGYSLNSSTLLADFNQNSVNELKLVINDAVHHTNDLRGRLGSDVLSSTQLFNYNEELQFAIFMDGRDVYLPISTIYPKQAFLVRNYTVESLDDVKQFMEENEGSLPSTLLVYDNLETENINLSESVIVPEQIVDINSVENANISMIEDAARYVSTAYLVDRENAGDYIVSNMTTTYPDYLWFATENLYEYYLTRDVLMSFTYSDDPLNMDDVTVQLIGVKQ